MAKVQKNAQSTKENTVFLLFLIATPHFECEATFIPIAKWREGSKIKTFIRDYRNEGSRSVRRLRTGSPSRRTKFYTKINVLGSGYEPNICNTHDAVKHVSPDLS